MRFSNWALLALLSAGTALVTYNLGQHPDLPHVLLSAHEELRQHTLRRSPGINRDLNDVLAASRELDAAAARAAAAAAAEKSAAAARNTAKQKVATEAPAALQKAAAPPSAAVGDNGRAVTVRTGGIGSPALLLEAEAALTQRVCGSPAIDGYAHVKPECLSKSPSAAWQLHWEALGGNRSELQAHIEHHADYDGLAVAWGIGNKKGSVEECAEACRQHKPNPAGGGFEPLPCNTFSYCPDEVCFELDAHSHSKGDCWLKFQEGPANPEVNFRGNLSAAARERHPKAPAVVQWHAGVLLPRGVSTSNGTWGPRYHW